MNIMTPIQSNFIQRIKQLSQGHPVFLLSMANGDQCVIKADGANRTAHLSAPIEIMNAVDPHAPSRVLSKTEMLGIRGWVMGHAADLEEQPGYLMSELASGLRPPLPGQGPQYSKVFIVMEAKAQLTDLQAEGLKGLGQDGDGNITVRDKSGVKSLQQVFKQPGVLEKLGEVLAVDAFNGNQDRINFEGAGKPWPGAGSLKCIQNPGNIFIGEGGGRLTVLGLDVFDPTNQFKDMNNFPEPDFAYPGRILRADAAARRVKLAQDVVADFETILGPRNRTFAFQKQTRMPTDACPRIVRGMESGGTKILNFLKQKFAGGGLGLGVVKRVDACGWLSKANFPRL
ncbi:MAG: hypothetical protein WCH32_09100 [Pseudomonadota bacterium]